MQRIYKSHIVSINNSITSQMSQPLLTLMTYSNDPSVISFCSTVVSVVIVLSIILNAILSYPSIQNCGTINGRRRRHRYSFIFIFFLFSPFLPTIAEEENQTGITGKSFGNGFDRQRIDYTASSTSITITITTAPLS